MDVSNILKAAKQAVEEAEVPDDLRAIAFERAIDLLAHQSGNNNVTQPAAHKPPSERPNADVEDGSLLSLMAKRLKVSNETVRSVFSESGNEIALDVPTGAIKVQKASGTKEIALLITAARQGSGLEDSTSLKTIRAVADEYKRLDSSNFAATIEELNELLIIRGQGKDRTAKLSRPGWEAAADLIKRLAGGDS